MNTGALPVAHGALQSIEDRVDRTPTSVHFIGSSSYMKFRFEDSPSVADILPEWKGISGGTQLWEYIFSVLQSETRSDATDKDEVVIITDGLDNCSRAPFKGINGYNHMMTQLKQHGVKLRISVLCIGSESLCRGADYGELAMATGGTFANVDPQESKDKRKQALSAFTDHISASNAARDAYEQTTRLDYEQRRIAGTAKDLSWYTPLSKEKGFDEKRSDSPKKAKSRSSYFHTVDL